MFKTLIKFAFFVMVTLLVTNFMLYYSDNPFAQEKIKLTKKFGTSPNKDARLDPIVHLANEKGQAFCTAFVIDANYAVTAGHCLDHNGKLTKEKLRFTDDAGKDCGVEVTAAGFHRRSDSGLLTGDFSNFLPLRSDFYNNGFQASDIFAACGFPYGQNHLSCNVLTSGPNEYFGVKFIGFLIPGMSGGPVINIKTGIAYGINSRVDDGYVVAMPLQGFLGIWGLD